jgi:anti-sigma B factor antagonist
MKISVERPREDQVVVQLNGQLDVDSSVHLKERLKSIAAEGTMLIVIDFQDVDFVDSSGLSALVSGLKAVRQRGGAIHLSRLQHQALTALRLTMLDRVFPIYPTISQALREGDFG